MQTDDLTCQELVELVTDFLDGVLADAERRRFEQHLTACAVCPRYVDQLRQTLRLMGRLAEDDVPEPARATLLEAFRTWKLTT